MAIKKIADYKDGKYRSFPSESIDKYKLKEKDYFLDYCKSFLHLYTNPRAGALVRHESSYLRMLEKYATGEQGATLVKEKLLRKNKNGDFYGKMGKVFQTYDILPEMLDVIFSINAKQSYAVSTLAYDDISSHTKEIQKSVVKFLLDRNTRVLMEKLELSQEGVSLSEAELAVYTEADVDAIFDSGGIQLDWEMAAKAVCNNVYVDSNAKKIENKCTEELLKWGFTAVRSYIDKSTGTPKIRNVDMKNLIVRDSKDNEFSDMTRFAEVRWISLIELKELCPSLTRDQYQEIIEGAGTYEINSHFANYFTEDNISGFYNGQSSLFDEIQVPILDAQWLANDVEHSLYFKKSDRVNRSKKVRPNIELSKKEVRNGDYIDKKKFVKRYDAIWLIGSDILLEYGVAKSNSYYGPKGNRTPRLDLSIIKTGKKSLVDRCRNFVEDINLLVAKLRHAIATLPPAPQLIVYQHALRGVNLNGKAQSAADLIRGLIEEGILVANGQDDKGNFISGNGGKAVENLNLHVIEQVTTYSNEIQANINRMRHVIGLPEGMDGTAGNPYQGLGKTQLAAMGSSNATFPVLSLIGPLFSKALLNCVGAYQALATDGDIELKDISVSEHASRIFKLSKNFSEADYNVKFTYAPNDEDKEFILNKLVELAAIHKQSNGAMGIQDSEYMMLYRLVKADRFEHAIRMLARFERLRKAEAEIRSQKLQEQNGQIQMQSTQVSEQEKRNTITAKAEEDRKTVILEKGLESINDSRDAMVESSATGEQKTVSAGVVESQKEEAHNQIAPVLTQVMGTIEEQNAVKEAQAQQAMAEQEQAQQA